MPIADRAQAMDGMEFLKATADGDLPAAPIMQLLDYQLVGVEAGRVVFACSPGEQHCSTIGVVHGGLSATLLDSAMACAVHSQLTAGVAYGTLEMKINLVKPIMPSSGQLFAEGRVIHSGKRIATAEGRLTDGNGTLYSHGSTTCMIFGREH